MTAIDEYFLNDVLDFFDRGDGIRMEFFIDGVFHLLCQVQGQAEIFAPYGLGGLEDGVCDFVVVIRDQFTVTFSDCRNHGVAPSPLKRIYINKICMYKLY